MMKDAMAPLSEIKAANTLKDSPKLGITQTKKKVEKGESKALFVVDPVFSIVVGDNEGITSKYAQELVSDVDALKSEDSKILKKSNMEVHEVVKEAMREVGELMSKNGLHLEVKLR